MYTVTVFVGSKVTREETVVKSNRALAIREQAFRDPRVTRVTIESHTTNLVTVQNRGE